MRIVTRLVCLIFFALFFSNLASAQVTLSGNVIATISGAPIEGVQLDLQNAAGDYIASASTDGSGDYSFSISTPDDYFVNVVAWGVPSPYLPEVWQDQQCNTDGNCDLFAVGTAIPVDGSSVGGKNFSLESGFTMSGTVLDNGAPVENIGVCVHYKSTGEFTGVCGGTDGAGNYTTGALPPSNDYMAYAVGYERGYKEQVYDGMDCPPEGCDLNSGTQIDLSSSDASGIDFNLTNSDPGIISGYILNHADQPEPGGAVWVVDQHGNWYGHFWTDENGYFESHPLPTGTYYAVTQFNDGYIADVWDGGDGAQCPNQFCTPQDYEPIALNSGITKSVTFRLDEIGYDYRIRGNVQDDLSNPLPYVQVVFLNSAGFYLRETQTNASGNYESPPMLEDFYYVRTRDDWGKGLAGELYDDHQCLPSYVCDDPSYMTANGLQVPISGGDTPGINFVLTDAPGLRVQGQITDSGNGKPLARVGVNLYDEFGNGIADTQTDDEGNYKFLGVDPGTYRVLVTGPPEGYQMQLFNGIPCPGWDCDISAGDDVVVSGADGVADFALVYGGTRIMGTVTRTNGGAPVASGFGYMNVNLFDASGNHIGGTGTDRAGNYQLHLPDSGGTATYYVSTDHDVGYHALVNECWNDVKCGDIYDPLNNGSNSILVTDGTTEVADFALDDAVVISGTIIATSGGAPIQGVYLDLFDDQGNYQGGGETAADGTYKIVVPGPGDYYVVTPPWGLPSPYLPEVWEDKPCNLDVGCDFVAVGNAIPVGSSSVGGKNFSLESGFTMSGTVLDNGAPVENIGVCVHYKSTGEFTGVCGGTDGAGNYTTGALPPSNDYMAYAVGYERGYKEQVYDGMDCPPEGCDLNSGTQIDLSSSDASGIDFNLTNSDPGIISGYILNHADQPEPGGAVWVVDQHGNWYGHFWTDENGYFESHPLPTGTYYAVTQFNDGYIADVWDGGDGAQCPNQFCTPQDYEPIALNSGITKSVTFRLDEIGYDYRIRGNVQDDLSNPLPYVQVVFLNSAGFYLRETQTNASGNYESPPMLEDFYYVRTRDDWGKGLAGELYDDHQCLPSYVCDDPSYMTANGLQVPISGGDTPGINFVLTDAPGLRVQGQITDSGNGKPLARVGVNLYDEFGNGIADTQTDDEGNYKFLGVDPGTYRVLVTGPPEGYQMQLFNGIPCPGWDCDISAGDDVVVSGADGVADFALVYGGTRIMGTVTRTNGGAPVASGFGYMNVNLFDASGNHIGGTGTDRAGNYQLHLPDSGGTATYYVSTDHDVGYHALVNECWNDVKCGDIYDPLNNGSNSILVTDGTTEVADFALDDAVVISGTIIATSGGAPIQGVYLDLFDDQGNYQGGGETAADGTYKIVVPGPGDYYVVTPPWGLPSPYLPEVWEDKPCNLDVGCDFVAVGNAIPVGSSSVGGKNFSLESGFTMSGTVLDNGAPVENIGVCVHYKSTGEFTGVCGGTDGAGNYTTGALPPSNDYMAYAVGYERGYKEQVYDGMDCPPEGCDLNSGTQIDLSSSDASGIDFNLTNSDPGIISGYILNHADQPEPGGAVWVVDQHGNWYGHFWTDENGYFESHPLPTGTYYAVTQFNDGYIADVWDGGDGAQCPNQFCTPQDYEPIALNSGITKSVTFRLDEIGYDYRIRGNVQDDLSNPLPYVQVVFLNSAGFYLRETQTNASGNYESPPMLEDFYYVRTRDDWGKGLAGELYDDHQCLPSYVCDDPSYMTANGLQVPISGGDTPGINFVLTDAPGLRVQGQITDSGNGKPLARVGVNLYDEFGNGIADTQTDDEGNYKFLGVDPGTYRVLVTGPPEGYQMQLFNGIPCPGWDCDISAGDDVVVSGADGVADFALVYGGTRIMGTVTRTNGGAPVASGFGYMNVNLFDASGNHIGGTGTDRAGNYQLHLPDSGGTATYYVSTDHDVGYHALVNECWNDVKCGDIYDPLNNGSNSILVTDGTTEVADFALDDAVVISGTIIATSGGAPIQGVYLDLFDDQGNYQGGGETAADGTYKIVVPGPGDYYVVTPPWGLPSPYLPEVWEDKPCNLDVGCDFVAVGNAIPVGSSSVGGKNFSLESGFTMSGTVLDNGAPVENIGVCVHYKSTGEFTGVCGGTDGAGNYTTGALPPSNDYMAYAVGYERGYKEQVYDGMDCPPEGCDLNSGTQIDLSSSDASGIDFNLTNSDPGIISGYILNHADQPEPGGAVWVVDQHGNWYGHFWTDENGYFESHPLPTGTYYAVTQFNDGYIADVWDGGDGAQCPNQFCTPQDYEPIALNSGITKSVTFRLDEIGYDYRIRGNVQDDLSNPLPYVQVVFLNSAGFYLRETQTNASGNYESPPMLEDFYYVRTRDDWGKGLAGELYDDHQCLPSYVCDDPSYTTANGLQVPISGGDTPGINFVLTDAPGLRVQGQITDSGNGKPLARVGVNLYDEFGNGIADTQTDDEGNYKFLGVDPGTYRVLVTGPPEGYQMQLFNGIPCPGWDCDISAGDDVVVSGADGVADFALVYGGTRIMGTVTRTNGGAPVASDFGYMNVNVFDASGNHIGGTGTDRAGNYQLHLPDSGGTATYYVSTDHDVGYHALVNECWNDVKCADPYDPISGGSTQINVADGMTEEADFALDDATTISGRVTDSTTGLGVEAQARLHAPDGTQAGFALSDGDGYYTMSDILPGTYYMLLNNRNGPLIDTLYDGPGSDGVYCPRLSCDVTSGLPIVIAEGEQLTGIDEALDAGSRISGFLQEGGNPVSSFNLFFYNPTDPVGKYAAFGFSLEDGSYISRSGLPAGSYYVSTQDPDNNGNAYEPLVYNNVYCGDICDRTLGDLVVVDGVNDVTDINFDMMLKVGAISGSVKDINGNPIPGGSVMIYDENGGYFDQFQIDDDGNFETYPLVPGIYFAVTKYTRDAIDDRWNGIDGEQCPNSTCDPLGGAPIEIIGNADTTGIDFVLDPISSGGVISGHLKDESTNPLFNVLVFLWNRDGALLQEFRTDQSGYYESHPRPDDTFYVTTWHGPAGQIPELYDDIQCLTMYDCYNGAIAAANGQPIVVSGGDQPGIDFVLSTPPGHVISGRVIDDDTGRPILGVWATLFDNTGEFLSEFETNATGDYYFPGLADGSYRVFARYVPRGYIPELYDDVQCADSSCDIALQGEPVNVSGGDVSLLDIGLQFEGTRITGTVTRTDNGEPVASNWGWFTVNLFDDAGNHIDQSETNIAGQYQLHLPGPGDYYLATANSPVDHGLVNECWDDIKCLDRWDPIGGGATKVTVAENETAIADFILDTGTIISGTVTAEVGGTPIENIQVCVNRQTDDVEVACVTTDATGLYEIRSLNPRDDYEVYTANLNGQAFYAEMHQDKPCCDEAGDPVDTTVSDQVVDFALEASASISGSVLDSSNDNPIQYSRVWLISSQCEFLAYGDTDENGDYTIAGFGAGTYYIAAFAEYQDYISTIYPNEQRMNVCHPDIQAGQALLVGNTEQLSGLDFALDPGGSINGFVSDSSGVLPNGTGAARLYDFDGNSLVVMLNWQEDGSYRIGGVIPGTYQVVLTSYNAGLVDERFDDETCPRNSCDPSLGVPVVVGSEEDVMGIDALLEPGALVSGRITDVGTGTGVPGGYCVAFYTVGGVYAGFACSDEDGYYASTTGLPDGEYLMSNAFWTDPAPGGYLAQVWTNDASFVACGDPCDFLLGDTFTVSGTTPVENLDLIMESGSKIPGSVTDALAAPLAGIEVQLLDFADGSVIRSVNTDAGGLYEFDGVGSGTYRVRTLNLAGYEDQLYGVPGYFSCNPFCDYQVGADVIATGFDDHPAIDFALQLTPAIQGNVTDDLGAPAFGVKVEAYNTLGSKIAESTTDSNGDYTLTSLWAGAFYIRTANIAGFVDALYDGDSCPAACDPTLGLAINLAPGQTITGIDMQMSSAASISGVVTDGTDPVSGIRVELYLDTGAFVASRVSNGTGAYLIDGLSAGDYHMVTRNNFGYIDEGAGGGVCQTACAPTSTAVVTVAPNASVVRDFSIDQGGVIEGTVFDSGSAVLQGVTVKAYNSAAAQIGSTVTDANGDYRIGGLVGGPVFLRTANAAPYRNRLYDSLLCDSVCDVLTGTAVAVVTNATSSGKDFHLDSGFSISGVVQDSGSLGLGGILVEAFDASENRVGFSFSVTGGAFEIAGLTTGDYQLRTTNAAGYVDRVHTGDTCSPLPCALNSGTATSIVSSDVSGVTIVIDTGSPISGVATDTNDNPLPTGTAWLYNETGSYLKSAAINSGLFFFTGIADGTYYMVISNTSGLVDQLYDGIDCPLGSCDVTTGFAIVIGAGSGAAAGAGAGASVMDSSQGIEPPPANDPPRLRAFLTRGYYIGGSITAGGNPVPYTMVYIFDENGEFAGEGMTDGIGNFISESGFPNGTYYATTSRAARPEDTSEEAIDAENGVGGGLVDQVWSGDSCDGVCEPGAGVGTPIVIQGSDRTDIVFSLLEQPGVDIQKLTNGVDADTPNLGDAPLIAPGGVVAWKYIVTNTGGGALSGISVVDNQGVDVDCGGQTTLPYGQSMECTAIGTAENLAAEPFTGVVGNCDGKPSSRLYQNIGTVTAIGDGPVQLSDEDASHYCNPVIVNLPDLMFSSGFE